MKNNKQAITSVTCEVSARPNNPSSTPVKHNPINDLANGHNVVRQQWGSDMGEMNFESEAANRFRAYIANSLLTTSDNTGEGSNESSSFSHASARIKFCSNGTFIETLSGYLGIKVKGKGILRSGADSLTGYWDVATIRNGTTVILMYSTHPSMLENSLNGFLPFIVAEYTPDFVALPGGAGYYRRANHLCN